MIPITLQQAASDGWFDPRFMQTYGVFAGAFGGAAAGLVGAAAGALAPRGKGRSVVLGLMWVFLGLGVAHLAVGLTTLIAGQEYGTWYPLLLIGLVLTLVMGGVIPAVRRVYQQAELRRLDAEGLRQG